MKLYSWYEVKRAEAYCSDEEREIMLEDLQDYVSSWFPTGKYNEEDEIAMKSMALLRFKDELFALGEKLLESLVSPDEGWLKAEMVYQYYGHYYLMEKRYPEALHWFNESLAAEISYPFSIYQDIAACYIEMGDVENANKWVEKCMEEGKSEGMNDYLSLIDYAQYYLSADQPQKALSLLVPLLEEQGCHSKEILPTIAKSYQALGDTDKFFHYMKEHLALHKSDVVISAELASAYFDLVRDHKQSEKYYLQSYEIAKKLKGKIALEWKVAILNELCYVYSDWHEWEKCFKYLLKLYKLRYKGKEAEPFIQVFENLPTIEHPDMGFAVYGILLDLENNLLLPHNRILGDEVVEDLEQYPAIVQIDKAKMFAPPGIGKAQRN